jgi:3-hydroxyisobutyrate dehydrogenase-like beta-hydroxyacid dehydrogenase
MESLTTEYLLTTIYSDDNNEAVAAGNELLARVSHGETLIKMGMYTADVAATLQKRLDAIVSDVCEALGN